MQTGRIVGVVLVLIGLFYVLAPHSLHVSSGLDFNLDHSMHIALGVVLLAAGAYFGWMMKPAKARGGAGKRRR